jgi:sarcosine oxidase subunit alpha
VTERPASGATGQIRFEGREVPLHEGDTIASALFRAGVRTFSRSLKLHRRRGIYCGTGECPNCLITVDDVPGSRSCITPALDGMTVRREGGWPSTERDALHVADRLHGLMPVGFLYKTFIHPRSAWPLAERVIRRATGLGPLPGGPADRRVARHLRTDVLVVGAGIAGLSAALEAAAGGRRVVLCEERAIGDGIAPGSTLERIRRLEARARTEPSIEILERHAALGLYEGPVVPLASDRALVQVHPGRLVLATGARERHAVFPGSDLPGVWLGRAAAAMSGLHGVPIGERVVVVATTAEGIEHIRTLARADGSIVAVVSPSMAGELDGDVETIVDARVLEARGRSRVREVVVRSGERSRTIACDALVLSLGTVPRDELARMAIDERVDVVGDAAGDRRCDANDADGIVCLCEDVSTRDLGRAWDEGFRSAEILKRYTTATMGPCQGAMCGLALECFARSMGAAGAAGSHRTTARPPLRPVALETLAASVHEIVDKRTGLHDAHLAAGARLDRSGGWLRPFGYGDRLEEYRAVRERVGLMDVGTLGKFLIAGRDATRLVDRVFATRVDDLRPGRSRYVIALDEGGYVVDDGLLCALGDGAFYLTSTTGGAERMDARLREWTDRFGLHVHLLDRTSELGAVLVAGPLARELLERVTSDRIDGGAIPYPGHGEVIVDSVPCRAVRSGFVGELAFELHHPRSRGPALWESLMRAGASFDIRPHGLDALETLRLEKGHVYLGQDSLPDDTPAKLGLGHAVAMGKPWFVGKSALERLSALPATRRLAGLAFDRAPNDVAELRGAPLMTDGDVVGRVTSAERSPVLDRAIGLGWIREDAASRAPDLRAGPAVARVVPTPFYDPEGSRVRA